MIKWLVILIFITPHLALTQSESVFHSLSQLDNQESIKIVLVSADWCQICDKTRKVLNSSEKIRTLKSSDINFYEFDVDKKSSVLLNGTTYNYIPSGINSGQHEFLSFLFKEGKPMSFPAIVILGYDNQIVQQFQGYLTEKEWVDLINALLH